MTGYGRSSLNYQEKTIVVDIRSLNSKFTDLRIKLPQNYREKEPELRKLINDKVERGKIDFTIEIISLQGEGEAYFLNEVLFKKYFQELNKIMNDLDIPKENLVQSILRLPNVVSADQQSIDEEEWGKIESVINDAFDKFKKYRLTEGVALEKDLRLRVENISNLLSTLDPFETERVQKLRQRLHQNLEEYLGKDKIDESRFEQEILFYLEKIDITEEKVRLAQHCKYFMEELDKQTNLKGRKLSFISQEMGREINTMGAKAYSHSIQKIVVGMKDELEKIKEQVANSL
ncbi:MAG: YicC/YloC family endoribonuclease [Bacteroidota bacterium]